MKRHLPYAALLAVTALAFAAGAFEFLELAWMDARFRWVERPAQESNVVVVAIDPGSIDALEVFPWSRQYHASLIENLNAARATKIAFDVDFSSRSTAEDDAEFAAAIEASRAEIVLPSFQQLERSGAGAPRVIASRPLDSFAAHARAAAINIMPDSGGLVRRYRLSHDIDGRDTPSLALALSGLPKPWFDDFYIDFGADLDGIPLVSYFDVLTGNFDPAIVRGRTVIVGATAVELGDEVAVPVYRSIPGPVLQAAAFEALTRHHTIHRLDPSFAAGATLLIWLITLPLVRRWEWTPAAALVLLLSLGALAASLAFHARMQLFVEVVPLLFLFGGTLSVRSLQTMNRQKLTLLLQALRLQQSETLVKHVVNTSFEGIVALDQDFKIHSCNPAAEQLFGLAADAVVGTSIERLLPDWQHWKELRTGEGLRGVELSAVHADGRVFPVELAVSVILEQERNQYVCFVRDISERKAHQSVLEHQANHDMLTGLPNRHYWKEYSEQVLRGAERDGAPAAFLVLDLDRFKEVNDTLGHHVGDELLQMIARRLHVPLREGDVLARIGGDEFAVVLPNTDVNRAREMACDLIQVMFPPFSLFGLSLQVDGSVGVAMYPDHGSSSVELMRRADVAMYAAKRAHAQVSVYQPDQDFTSVRHLTLNGELRRAIEEDQLELNYQPKVSCDSGSFIGVEALVRWRHPRHGSLSPQEFIAVAEHTGLINSLSHWVLETAIRQCGEWRKRGLDINVAVNLSARNLQEPDLPDRLREMMERFHAPASYLTVEITESVLMENPEHALEVLTRFSELGVAVAIDDFGTGYSSLAYLKRLPARELKIDRTFVSGIYDDRDDAVIVRSTIDLAHNLGLSVVAEGIESEEVWTELKRLECDSGQGFFFTRPLPADELLAWLDRCAKVRTLPAGEIRHVIDVA